jgi:hypothetical protein
VKKVHNLFLVANIMLYCIVHVHNGEDLKHFSIMFCIIVFQLQGCVIRTQVDNAKIVTFVLLIEIIDHCNFSSKLVMHARCLESHVNKIVFNVDESYCPWFALAYIT